ncbi:MAG: energy transducer TonB [Bacteroidales bacterium]|nr:energy transducer TonB [Bacteroidales bacterium]
MSKEERNKTYAFIGTALFHALLLLLFILFALRTPLPLPGEEGVEVSLGYTDAGMGREQPSVVQPASAPAPRPEPSEQKEEIVTQTTEETVAIPAQEEEKIEPKPQPPKPEPKVEPKPDPEPEPPKVDPRALYPPRTQESQTGQNEGATGQAGDQGRPDGSPDRPSNEGIGGAGEGISFSLSGRSAVDLPDPEYPSREECNVVVTIWVDKVGKVISATAGARGTTTTDPALRKAAEQAALRARFSPNPDAPEQTGTITYNFRRRN